MRLSQSFHEMRMRERIFAPSGPEKNLPNKAVSKIDNVSMKHSGFDETAFFNRKKSVSRNTIAILIAKAYLDRMLVRINYVEN